MHEQLIPHKHPTCTQEIINLNQCHKESGIWQMFGICNSAKDALDVCFKRERAERRAANFEKGKERRGRWEALVKDIEDGPASPSSMPSHDDDAASRPEPAPADRSDRLAADRTERLV